MAEVWENQETGERRRLGVSARRPEGEEWERVYPKPKPEPKPPKPEPKPKPKRRKRRVKAKPDTSTDDIPEQSVCEPLPPES